MTEVYNTDNLESKLNLIGRLAVDFTRHAPLKPWSIESNGDHVWFNYTETNWSKENSDAIEALCEKHNVSYGLVPFDGKFVVTIQ